MLDYVEPIFEYDRGRGWLLSFPVSPVSWSLSPPEIPIRPQPSHKNMELLLIHGLWARPVGAIGDLHAPTLSLQWQKTNCPSDLDLTWRGLWRTNCLSPLWITIQRLARNHEPSKTMTLLARFLLDEAMMTWACFCRSRCNRQTHIHNSTLWANDLDMEIQCTRCFKTTKRRLDPHLLRAKQWRTLCEKDRRNRYFQKLFIAKK